MYSDMQLGYATQISSTAVRDPRPGNAAGPDSDMGACATQMRGPAPESDAAARPPAQALQADAGGRSAGDARVTRRRASPRLRRRVTRTGRRALAGSERRRGARLCWRRAGSRRAPGGRAGPGPAGHRKIAYPVQVTRRCAMPSHISPHGAARRGGPRRAPEPPSPLPAGRVRVLRVSAVPAAGGPEHTPGPRPGPLVRPAVPTPQGGRAAQRAARNGVRRDAFPSQPGARRPIRVTRRRRRREAQRQGTRASPAERPPASARSACAGARIRVIHGRAAAARGARARAHASESRRRPYPSLARPQCSGAGPALPSMISESQIRVADPSRISEPLIRVFANMTRTAHVRAVAGQHACSRSLARTHTHRISESYIRVHP